MLLDPVDPGILALKMVLVQIETVLQPLKIVLVLLAAIIFDLEMVLLLILYEALHVFLDDIEQRRKSDIENWNNLQIFPM